MEDQMKLLEEALNVVKVQAHHMKKCLVCQNIIEYNLVIFQCLTFLMLYLLIGQQQTHGRFKALFNDVSRTSYICFNSKTLL